MELGRLFLPSVLIGYCYQDKGECNLNQSNVDPFVERVAKDNSEDVKEFLFLFCLRRERIPLPLSKFVERIGSSYGIREEVALVICPCWSSYVKNKTPVTDD